MASKGALAPPGAANRKPGGSPRHREGKAAASSPQPGDRKAAPAKAVSLAAVATAEATPAGPKYTPAKGNCIVLGKYELCMGKDDILGEGSFCTARKGICRETDKYVAIKLYKKTKRGDPNAAQVSILKFRRQVEVLQEMQRPLRKGLCDSRHWHTEMDTMDVKNIFIQLIEYSKDKNGDPGNDVTDGVAYLAMELAEYSMKDFLADCRDQKKTIANDVVREICKQVVLVVAGLHAKGLVHLDLKPENLMMGADNHWKLIDVDGCVKIDDSVNIEDNSLSFSPCYCAPEWARFLVEGDDSLVVRSTMDVWSVGMTLCELVTLKAVLQPKYTSYVKQGWSQSDAGYFFLEWLGFLPVMELDPRIQAVDDTDFIDLLQTMLETEGEQRMTLCELLDHPFLQKAKGTARQTIHDDAGCAGTKRRHWHCVHDMDDAPPLFAGILWKLNIDGDPTNPDHWLKRNMWLSTGYNLCYFSQKENKKLVYLDRAKLSTATVASLSPSEESSFAQQFVFKFDFSLGGEHEAVMFAAESEAERTLWLQTMEKGMRDEDSGQQKCRTDKGFIQGLRAFKLQVNNRRKSLRCDSLCGQGKGGFDPIFREKLWKLKAEGDPMVDAHWFLRDMWVGKNGSLCYHSKKESRDLMYYNQQDLSAMSVRLLGEAARPHAFVLTRRAQGELEYEPGIFAGETAETRDQWIAQFEEAQMRR